MARRFFVIVLIISAVIIIAYYYIPKNKIENNIENKVIMDKNLILTSPAFENMRKIPVKYTCDGQKINPALEISGVAENAKSLVLIMDDPDAPMGTFDHWWKFNLPVTLTKIEEATDPKYIPPCPPDREHRYFFKLYSLDTMLDLKSGASKKEIEKAMQGHILQQTELIGLYKRQ